MTFEEAKTWIARSGLNRSADALAAIVAEFEKLKTERDEAYYHRRLMLDTDLQMRTLVALQRDITQRDARIVELEKQRDAAWRQIDPNSVRMGRRR